MRARLVAGGTGGRRFNSEYPRQDLAALRVSSRMRARPGAGRGFPLGLIRALLKSNGLRSLLLSAAMILQPSASADEIALVKVGDLWRYLPGTAAVSAQHWHDLDYDDSGWRLGPSGFIAGPYYTEATVMTNMIGNFSSVFFRRSFQVANPESIKWLILRADYNDGFVAYLNGQEIARRGVSGPPGLPPAFDATSTVHFFSSTEEIDVSEFAFLLQTGPNILAIQAHNTSLFDFNFLLVPELLANFVRGPFIQNSSAHSVQIIYKTPIPADTAIEYGESPALGQSLVSTNLETLHVSTLVDLKADTLYFYRVRSTAGGVTAASPVETFRTFKTAGSIRFMVFADSGAGSVVQYQIADVLRRNDTDLVLHAGDIIYPGFQPPLVDTKCLSVYRPHMKNVPYFFAIGNHDLAPYAQPFLDAFYLPTNNVDSAVHLLAQTSPEHYYSFDHGDAHFTVLCIPYLNQYDFKVGDPQYRWFTNDLATSTRKWKFLIFHHPPRTSGPHGFDDQNSNGLRDQTDVLLAILPAASRYGVQLIFTGHDHDYERFVPTNGVHSVVTGGGGIYLYGLTERQPGSAQFIARQHCLKISIQDDALELNALDKNGNLFDTMFIQRAPPAPRVWPSFWHTPVQPKTDRSNDNDGNREGQVFDLVGESIPALTGEFSNLGRIHVNNDRTNVYIGFKEAMFYAFSEVFLFIESRELAGVPNMVGLGNGVIDPDEQGADGLDFLKNLSFTNFTPAIGCILGDEFADGQFRSFRRPGSPLNAGQGIFHLNGRLSDIAGGRVQQFNRSPQKDAAPGESSADFMVVTIPLSALSLKPGDPIKIGAVVGGENLNTTSERQSRQLDSGYLGRRFELLPGGKAILEGVEIKLSADEDPDQDGLLTQQELRLGTNPNRYDTDGDGLSDGYEVAMALNPLSSQGAEGGAGDPDGDGLSNLVEQEAGTNPRKTDSDDDSLPDDWEYRNNLDPLLADEDAGAAGDPDRDGMTNWAEWMAGTDPHESQSRLQLSVRLDGASLSLEAKVVPGKKYLLEYADRLPGPFVTISSGAFPLIALSNTLQQTDSLAGIGRARFYRLRIIP